MNSKLLGGILLIVGTCIGGAMLALPIATAEAGFTNAIIFLFFSWLVMTIGAFLVLEVNLRLPPGSNMASMAKATLGVPGQIIAWFFYLLLLYTLLAAYIAGGADVFTDLLSKIHINSHNTWTALIFTAVFSFIVYCGIRSVDYVNRGLMFAKLGVYLLLVLLISPHINPTIMLGGSMRAVTGSLMVLMTSFGYAAIIPSLREYFQDDIKGLRRVILIGSVIPLVCYVLWIAVIMGVVQRSGDNGLVALMSSSHATSGLVNALSQSVESRWISGFFGFFSSICMLTAFLGVSIGLFDFIADGLNLQKKGLQGKSTLAITFIPPLAVVLINPGIYLSAINYAGICCVILQLLLPGLMAWKSRQKASSLTTGSYTVPGGNVVLVGTLLVSVYLLVLALR